ncbi:hypothetical protein DPEC_G00364800 [Dallia pectoralis]|nr:hypothetical protein DPEC_G00364800 [Dallia pectoralis]
MRRCLVADPPHVTLAPETGSQLTKFTEISRGHAGSSRLISVTRSLSSAHPHVSVQLRSRLTPEPEATEAIARVLLDRFHTGPRSCDIPLEDLGQRSRGALGAKRCHLDGAGASAANTSRLTLCLWEVSLIFVHPSSGSMTPPLDLATICVDKWLYQSVQLPLHAGIGQVCPSCC